jgi:hypothetical protein|tara:strand:- start:1011 stop:1451 length:441 start_codon:yes stop_codon:yes gene_type:complete
MSYKGKYKIKKPEKYAGDASNVIFRSLWERNAFRWCEDNPKVKLWNSEGVVVPYKCSVDKKLHRYFVDLLIEMDNKKIYLIEIKPKSQTLPPKKKSRKTKKYINEALTFSRNQDKWNAADKFAKHNGWQFQVWTEETLKNLGIKVL